MRIISVVVIFLLTLMMSASADTLNLKTGESYEGDIVERTDSYVRINIEGDVETYNWADIKSIARRVVEKDAPTLLDVSADDSPSDAAEGPENKPAVQPKAAKVETPISSKEPPGYNGIEWGQGPQGFPFLKYVFTDPATGVNIYVDADDLSESGRGWKTRTQYHFWNDQFFKMTHLVPSKQAWQYLKDNYTRQYGEQENNEDNPNIYIWDGDDAMIAINFDDDYQEGSFVMASKELSESINAQDSTALTSLINALDESDNEVRTRVVLNLGVMKSPEATLSLIPLLRDKNFIVRYNTAYALGEIKDDRAVPSLIIALEDEDDFVRSFAAEALGKIGSEEAVKPLIEVISQNDQAKDALQQITGKDFGHDQQSWQAWWQNNQRTSL